MRKDKQSFDENYYRDGLWEYYSNGLIYKGLYIHGFKNGYWEGYYFDIGNLNFKKYYIK